MRIVSTGLQKIISALATVTVISVLAIACGGVGSGGTASTARQVAAFRSLRLGQTDAPNSPVATTAAANNGEALVLLNQAPGSTALVHALYVTAAKDVVRISIGPDGLPLNAETADTAVSFANFTDTTVDLTFTANGVTSSAITAPLPDDVIKLIATSPAARASSARALESEEVLRALFRAAIIAVRTFGCSGGTAARSASVPPDFLRIADASCSSLLIQLLSALIAEDDFAARAVFGLSEVGSCDFNIPGWADDFNNAVTCALGLSEQLLATVRTLFPAIETSLADPTPVPTPTAVPQPTRRPQEPQQNNDEGEEELHCTLGEFSCANRDKICREQLCNGIADCSDGTDESGSTCTPEVVCCIVSGGCPGESSGSCAPTCCCCGVASQCDQDTYGGGCESAPLRTAPWNELSTFRKWFAEMPASESGRAS